MLFHYNRILTIFTMILVFLMTSCDESEPQIVEIDVLSTITEKRSKPNESEITKIAVVKYCVKNVGSITIHGWKVFFNIHVERGPQITAHESIYYTLTPEEISDTQIIKAIIPDYYENATGATLKHIETW